jgi:hypothetical protein
MVVGDGIKEDASALFLLWLGNILQPEVGSVDMKILLYSVGLAEFCVSRHFCCECKHVQWGVSFTLDMFARLLLNK